jgi:uncharacterized protein (TIGR00251 family)
MIISVKVKPNSKENRIEENTGRLVAYLKAPAEKNKANTELIKLLAKHFSLPIAKIKIIKGKASRNKVVEINM